MADEDSFTSLLEDSFTVDDVGCNVSKLKVALENLNQKFETEVLQQILQECLSSCPESNLNEKIFSEILPLAHRFLLEVLEKINTALNANIGMDALDSVKRQLILCHESLSFWEKCTEHVSKLRNVAAISVKYLFENVPGIIIIIFEHCKSSQQLYGCLFESVSNELTNLFRKAQKVLKLFLTTLEDVIVFDTDTESETELLVKVINAFGAITTIANALDLKTFVEVTKIFGKLAITYQRDVKRISSASVTSHLEQMTKDLSSMLSALKDARDRIDERKIKVIGHLLKILDKLFATYCSCINDDTLLSVIELLLKLHRYSPSCLKALNIDKKIIDLINVAISLGIEPFLNTIFKNTDFKQAYFEYGYRTDIDKLAYHLLTLSIMKKLIGMPYEHHCKWILGADSILDVALTNIHDIQEEICVGELRLPGAYEIGERPRYATLYEATIVPMCTLISQIQPDGFHPLELLLLKHLLSNRLWSSLLSTDIWCFIGRLGSTELCVDHVRYLLKVYATLINRQNSLEIIMLEKLIGRLYMSLSDEAKHSLVVNHDDFDNHLWIPIAPFLLPETKSFLQTRLACRLNEISNTFTDLQRQPTVQNWNRLTSLLSLSGKLSHTADKSSIDILIKVWNSIASTIEDVEGKQLDILSDFITILLNAARPGTIQDDVFFTILEAVLASSLCFPAHVKVIAAHYLRNNAELFSDCSQKTAGALSEFNCRLLEDENPWVRQEALDSFDHVAHMCPNDDLVTKMAAAVTRKPSISDSVPAYLCGEVHYELRNFPDVGSYLRHLVEVCRNINHVCYSYEETHRDEKLAKMESQSDESSTDDLSSRDRDRRVNQICDELNDILRIQKDLSDRTLRRLQMVCAKIVDLESPR